MYFAFDSSDLQLAIALQQQEFEQQTSQRQNNSQPPSVGGGRLVTGPQVHYKILLLFPTPLKNYLKEFVVIKNFYLLF